MACLDVHVSANSRGGEARVRRTCLDMSDTKNLWETAQWAPTAEI